MDTMNPNEDLAREYWKAINTLESLTVNKASAETYRRLVVEIAKLYPAEFNRVVTMFKGIEPIGYYLPPIVESGPTADFETEEQYQLRRWREIVFDCYSKNFSKIETIKTLRQMSRLGLKEAKDFVENVIVHGIYIYPTAGTN